ncbi:MAG: M48 family metalloprotease [Sneathiella sp.]
MRLKEMWRQTLQLSTALLFLLKCKNGVHRLLLALPLISVVSFAHASTNNVADLFSIFEPKDEGKVGAAQHPRIVAQYGGEYVKEGLNDYILDVVLRLVSVTERKGEPWRVTILNSPAVNAFALPGGYVYVTRGLLAIADSEAEVAGVLAHEIGHVIARHGAGRQSRATGVGLLGAIAGILTQSGDVARLGQTVGGLFLADYSRDQEYEADKLGVKYLGLAGYPRDAMAAFLVQLQANADYIKGQTGDKQKEGRFDFFSSHPQTEDRVERAKSLAQNADSDDEAPREAGRVSYLGYIDGLLFGEDVREGVIRKQTFLHPNMRFQFDAPENFKLTNSARAVFAGDGKGNQMVFDFDLKGLRNLSPAEYMKRVWLQKAPINNVTTIEVSGSNAAISRFVVKNKGSKRYVTAVAINFGANRVARFVYNSKTRSKNLEGQYEISYASFRPMQFSEAEKIKPVHLSIKTVSEGEDFEDLLASMAEQQSKKELFLLLNSKFQKNEPSAGQLYKLPVAEK